MPALPSSSVDITQGSLLGKLLRHSPVYLTSSLIIAFTAFLLLPVNTRLFREDDYGAISTIDAASDLVIILVSLNLITAYMRHYYEYKDDPEQLSLYTSTIYWFIAGWGALATVGSLLVSGFFLPAAIPVWPVLALAFSSTVLIQLGQLSGSYLQQIHRPVLQVSLNLANFLTHAALMLILAGVFKLGLTGKYIAVLCGGLLSAAIGTWVLIREGLLRWRISWPMLKESLIFAIPLLPNAASGWITGLSDRILLARYGSLAETGIYNVGYLLGRGITIFSEAIFLVYGPMIYAMLKKDPATAQVRIARFVPYFFMFMLWMCLGLSLFAAEIVAIVAPARYASATTVVPIVLSAYFLGSQYKTFVLLLSYHKQTLVISLGSILQASVNLGANLLLIPRYGKIAAAWTTLIALAIYLGWLFIWSQKNFRLELDYRRITASALVVAAAAGGAALLLDLPQVTGSLALTIGVKAMLLLGVAAVTWFAGLILPVDKRQIKSFLRLA